MNSTNLSSMEDIGNFVSIVLRDERRVEGILGEVDLPNHRIAVTNVRDYGTEGRKIQNPQIPPSRGIQLRMSIREREIKDLELIYLSSNEREFPSLSQRLIHAANQINPRRSYRDMAAN